MPSVTESGNRSRFGRLKALLSETYQEWSDDKAPRLGAALAFYTMLSLAPLLILLIALAGLVFGEQAARGQLQAQIQEMVGPQGAQAIQSMIENAAQPGAGIFASVLGFITLLFGASSVANELKDSLNQVWDVETPGSGIKGMVKQRSYALVVVVGCGFLLLVSLVVSSAISAAGAYAATILPLPSAALLAINFVVALAVITGVFAVLFKYLPDIDIDWRQVLPGALFTAVLFSIGKFLIGLYLGRASFGSTYGAAGSLVIVLVWVYYSSQIIFFGAEFTQVYSRRRGFVAGGPDVHQRAPKPVQQAAPTYAHNTATGNTTLTNGTERGMVGTLIGSALAITRAARGFRR